MIKKKNEKDAGCGGAFSLVRKLTNQQRDFLVQKEFLPR